MLTGKIKSYNPTKAFGFIEQEDADDLFFFKNAFLPNQYNEIEAGKQVNYVVVAGQKGPQAAKATIVD